MQRELTGRETVNWQTNRSHEVVSPLSRAPVQQASPTPAGGRGRTLGLANLVSVHCNWLDDWSWAKPRRGSDPPAGRRTCSLGSAVARASLGALVSLGPRWVNYDQILTSEMKIAPRGVRDNAAAALGPTRATAGSKLGALEFRLACYQWGNSWCLYSFCLIGPRLGLALFAREPIGPPCEPARNLNWQ